MKNINWPLGWETELFNVQTSHQAVVSQLFLSSFRLRLLRLRARSRVLRRIIHIRNLFNLPTTTTTTTTTAVRMLAKCLPFLVSKREENNRKIRWNSHAKGTWAILKISSPPRFPLPLYSCSCSCVPPGAMSRVICPPPKPQPSVSTFKNYLTWFLIEFWVLFKVLNLGSLFGQQQGGYPNYGYQYPSYGYSYNNGYNYGYSRPSTGYYPSTGTGYYPSTNYGNSGYYPSTGAGVGGSGYYYPSSGGAYYPTTNILGSSGGYGGYGGYGGNGGLRQYSGYWQPDYNGQRNRGYGYYSQTDRFGLPPAARERDRDYNYRDRVYGGGYRGYD